MSLRKQWNKICVYVCVYVYVYDICVFVDVTADNGYIGWNPLHRIIIGATTPESIGSGESRNISGKIFFSMGLLWRQSWLITFNRHLTVIELTVLMDENLQRWWMRTYSADGWELTGLMDENLQCWWMRTYCSGEMQHYQWHEQSTALPGQLALVLANALCITDCLICSWVDGNVWYVMISAASILIMRLSLE